MLLWMRLFVIFGMMGIHLNTKRYSLAEYLEREEMAEFKSEFYNGHIVERPLFAPEHSLIAANCLCVMGNALENKNFRVFESSLMIQIERINAVLYADGSIFCNSVDQNPIHRNLVRNPSLILEVGASNFFKYQMIPSLQTYVLVGEKEPLVHVAIKNLNGGWNIDDYCGMEAVVDLKPFGVSITMAQIYKWVTFS